MRLLLVNPSITGLSYDVPPILPPLGIMYIASMARKRGHEVSIFDVVAKGDDNPPEVIYDKDKTQPFLRYGCPDEVLLKQIENFKPDLVGLSNIMAVTENECLRLVKLIKENYPSLKAVIGGTNSTARVRNILETSDIDFVYRGEGDADFMDFLDLFHSADKRCKVPGICYKENGDLKITEQMPILRNLDDNPIPAWDLIESEIYLDRLFPFSFHLMPRTTTMMTTRGCVRNCVFCTGKKMLGYWRSKSVENTIKEALILKEKYGVEEVQFLDSNISINRKHFMKFLALWEDKVKLPWAPVGGLDVSTIDGDVIQKMGESGCHSFPLGIEAGSTKIQEYIGKIVPKEKVVDLCRAARKQGMWTHGLFVIGFPNETEEDVYEILDYSKVTDLDSISMFALSPLPGSELYSNFIDDYNFEPDLSRIVGSHFHLASLPYDQMNRIREDINRKFFWWKLVRELRISSIVQRVRSPKFSIMVGFIIKAIKRFLLLKRRDKVK